MITFGQLGTSDLSGDVSYSDMPLPDLIQEFKAAEMNLKIALEQAGEEDIQKADASLSSIVDHLLAFECKTKEECKTLYGFLVQRFVEPNLEETSVGHNVCQKILAHFQ